MLLTGVAVLCVVYTCQSYSFGPPTPRCDDMMPSHDNKTAQTSVVPYSVVLNATSYRPNDVIEVNVTSNGAGGQFKGLFLQMREYTCSKNSTTRHGQWSLVPGTADFQLITCPQSSSAVGHANGSNKTEATFYWQAPTNSSGHLHVVATVVREKLVFWAHQSLAVVKDATVADLDCSSVSSHLRATAAMLLVLVGIFFNIQN